MKLWEKALVKPKTPIRDLIKIIDTHSLQIGVVVDAEKKLLGTVTDGDVRRGILRGIGLDEPVERIMRKRCVSAPLGEDRETILTLMKKKQIHQVPLVDKKNRVAGLEYLDELLSAGSRENWVVLMAGGLGSRLKPLTDNCPKPLLNVGTKPILETILENFIEYGFKNFYIAVNYKNEMVKRHFGDGSKWGVHIRYLEETQKLGTAGALSLLPSKPAKPFFVMNGDLLTKVNFSQLLHFHAQNKSDATMCVREYDFQVPFGVVKMTGHHILGIDEKPAHRFYVNAGIYLLGPDTLKYLPKNAAMDMPQLFQKLIYKKYKAAAFPIREYWLDIGRMDDLERANGEFSEVFR